MEEYLNYSMQELEQRARIPLVVLKWGEDVLYAVALAMANEIEQNNLLNLRTVFLCPAGPAKQYDYFAEFVNRRRISLQNCWFINMAAYLDDQGEWLAKEHPLSLRGWMEREVYQKLDPLLVMPEEQRVFPDPHEPQAVSRLIRELGGVSFAFGGIGLDGHLGFNEPSSTLSAERFAASTTRIVELAPLTRVVHALASAGGAVECVPQKAVTVGMAEILSAQRVYIGLFRTWHRYVVRRTACGDVSAQFPATLLQRHRDAQLVVSEAAARTVYDGDPPEPEAAPAMELAIPRRARRRTPAAVGGGGTIWKLKTS